MNHEAVSCGRVGCNQQILWTVSPTGAKLCVNARSATVYVLRHEADGLHTHKLVITDEDFYVSHWLTCKNPPH